MFAHRFISAGAIIGAIVIGYLFFGGSSATAQTRYVLGTVEQGTLMISVSSTGQIEASDQIDVRPKASGEVTAVLVAEGQQVKAGQTLAYIDATNAQQAVKNATIALESATISLQKLQRNQTVDAASATDDLEQAYVDAMGAMSDAFLKLPDLITEARGILYDDTLKGVCSPNECQYGNLVSDEADTELAVAISRAENDYAEVREVYDTTFANYRTLRHDAAAEEIIAMLDATKNVTELLAQTAKSEQNLLDLVVDDMTDQAAKNGFTAKIPAQLTIYQDATGSALSSLNSILSKLNSIRRAIQSAQKSLTDSTFSDPLDLASQKNTVAQREDDLREANRELANCVIRAPIAGVVSAVNVKRGDTASSGTAVATVVSSKRLAVVALNEADIADVLVGQKVTLTFDAIEDLTMTGVIANIDQLGTTAQGVVSYGVTIALDTQDIRIRPGMSISANIITNIIQNALMVPSAAVKTQNGTAFVQAIDGATPEQLASIGGFVADTPPRQIEVKVGASNDTMTQIISGVAVGDTIVARTVSGTTKTSTTSNGMIGGGEMRAFTR